MPNESQRRPLENGMVQGDVVTFQVILLARESSFLI